MHALIIVLITNSEIPLRTCIFINTYLSECHANHVLSYVFLSLTVFLYKPTWKQNFNFISQTMLLDAYSNQSQSNHTSYTQIQNMQYNFLKKVWTKVTPKLRLLCPVRFSVSFLTSRPDFISGATNKSSSYVRRAPKTMNPMYVKRGGCCRDSSHDGPPMRKEAALEFFSKWPPVTRQCDARNKKNKMAALKGVS